MKFDIVRYVCLFTHGKKLNLRDTVVVGFSLYPKFVIYIYMHFRFHAGSRTCLVLFFFSFLGGYVIDIVS